MIFDGDEHEESVFVDKFVIKDRANEDLRRPLRDGEVSMQVDLTGFVDMTAQVDMTGRGSHFSMSFAQDEPTLEVVEEDEDEMIRPPHYNP